MPLPIRLRPAALPAMSPKKRWAFRLVAVFAIPALLFTATEGALRLAGIGHSTDFFIPDSPDGFYRTNPRFTDSFLPAHFDLKPLNFRLAKKKPPGTLRVFVLGESAVFGTPEPAFGFVAQLRAQLRSANPGKPIEVYNLGITAINSHVVYRMARELRSFAPDLVVVYLGNNEVIGPFGPGSTASKTIPSTARVRTSVALRSLRLGQLLARLSATVSPARNEAPEWRGVRTFSQAMVRGDDPRLETVYANFETNLRDLVQQASGSGAKVILSTVVANLKANAPFASAHRASLSDADLAAWACGLTSLPDGVSGVIGLRLRYRMALDMSMGLGGKLPARLRTDPRTASSFLKSPLPGQTVWPTWRCPAMFGNVAV